MSSLAIGLTGIGGMLILLFLRQPVWLTLLLCGVVGNIVMNNGKVAQMVAATNVFDTSYNYGLSVIPLFILMGEVATRSRMSAELFAAARVLLTGVRGGLPIATIAASGAFGAICGSSVATAAAMTRIALPEMRKAGYEDGYAAASIAAGGSLGILIPPSVILLIYASIAEVSIARLFAASMIPGIVLMLVYIAVAVVLARKAQPRNPDLPVSILTRVRALLGPWQFVLLFVLTIGGIYTGIFSPNEAAAIGAFGAIVLGLAQRSLTLAHLVDAIQRSVIISCVLFMVIIGATVFANFVVQTRMPDLLLAAAADANMSAAAVMGIIILAYIVMGCFLEGIGMVLITVPVFLPVVVGFGFDPIWFGVLVTILVELGLLTPPVGMNLFIIKSQVPDMKMRVLYNGILPFLIAPLIVIALMFSVPEIATWLPDRLF
ncbi:TRAP transporter large permease [Pseudoruegeria sp. SK021]|uniref:TRAP transporter large permease n=1 Tax=Pseudoruegeria sp. SK021 TaxID=1933035 RepID=UPI000A231877|nr:TRAP transporter large permease [Pseudoruegeria sp. SK021]OSP54887.1 C4-dicarboxylate ABC transporter permease [Pseudoruegeria sp. SK021]